MNVKALQQKIESLATFSALNPGEVKKLGEVLVSLSGWDLYRINPLQFAKKQGLNQKSIIDIFIHGAKIGLFDFEWNLICPMCGAVISSMDSIGKIRGNTFYCSTCDVNVKTDLSNYVEAAFSIDPGIEELNLDPFSNHKNYRKYFFSANHRMSGAFNQYYKEQGLRDFTTVAPGDTNKISFPAQPNQLYRLVSVDNNSLLRIKINDQVSEVDEIIDIDLLPRGFAPQEITVPAGNISLIVHNHLNQTSGISLHYVNFSYVMDIIKKDPPRRIPFVTGKQILNNQSFRELFRIQSLPTDLQLKVSNITILFTDLKGSTALYDKTGDLHAYNLVQKHFEILKESTRNHCGAIIKTIGDAIMAAFSNPKDGLMAAFDMMGKIDRMSNNSNNEIGIKLGLHSGTALAVAANETLDYFGQTVNIAARVQGLADAGEIWLTEPIKELNGFTDLLSQHGYNIEEKSAVLKGVSSHTVVFRCTA